MLRGFLLAAYEWLYQKLVLPRFFEMSAQDAHEWVIEQLSRVDQMRAFAPLLRGLQWLVFKPNPTQIGEKVFPTSVILAAGFVKGLGFSDEAAALQAVGARVNIIPGWRTIPALLGVVEFGSYTRWPRIGNAGEVIWRDVLSQSTQNRVGLKNPGAIAAAEFLALHRLELPPHFGINIALSPGIVDRNQEIQDVIESVEAFLLRGVRPTWFTLNLSCPNTEDDPTGNQSYDKAVDLGRAIRQAAEGIPIWIKIGPDLGAEQYQQLYRAFEEIGIAAVIATNTLGQPAPDDSGHMAGVGGKDLEPYAKNATQILLAEKDRLGGTVDVIACGGIFSGEDVRQFGAVQAIQYWSGMIYRGPLVAALIAHEWEK